MGAHARACASDQMPAHAGVMRPSGVTPAASTHTIEAPPTVPVQTIDTLPVDASGAVTFLFTVDINDGTVTPGGFVIDRYLDPYHLVVRCGPLPPVTVIGHPVIIGP